MQCTWKAQYTQATAHELLLSHHITNTHFAKQRHTADIETGKYRKTVSTELFLNYAVARNLLKTFVTLTNSLLNYHKL